MAYRKTENDLAVDAATLARLLEQGEPVTVLDVRPRVEGEEWFIV